MGEQIRTARLAADVSQEALAEKIGMTRTNYARIEGGRTNVTLDSLLRIADGLGVELSIEVSRPKAKRSGR
ncbi:XRE family transcriptional regulator [bacterium]|nr:MAG: XRE family transcriptional regulator [bacterium]